MSKPAGCPASQLNSLPLERRETGGMEICKTKEVKGTKIGVATNTGGKDRNGRKKHEASKPCYTKLQ